MKRYIQQWLATCVLGCAIVVSAQPFAKAQHLAHATTSQAYYQAKTLDVNRLTIRFNNQGYLDYLNGKAAEWPEDRHSVIVFDQGFWIIGKMNQELRLALSMWGSSYSPGPIINGKSALQAKPGDSLRYRAYKVSRNDTPDSNLDCAEWPIELGAPIVESGKIELLGDQMVWMVYNGADSAISYWWKRNLKKPLQSMPIEIQQTAYANAIPHADSSHILANTVFVEWKIVNKGNLPIDSVYVSLWTDIDFGNISNPPAIDTINQVGYCWYGRDDSTSDFGTRAPAIGYVWLYGPSVASPGNSAIFQGRRKAGYKNLSITSFWGIHDDECNERPLSGLACTIETAWNIARGFDKSGKPIINPTTGQATKFPYSGDPVAGTGWLHSPNTGGGAGFNIFSGPFNLAPNDTQWVMVALVPTQGTDRLDSIRKLREYARILRSVSYSELANPSLIECRTPTPPHKNPDRFALLQNYPNPFSVSKTLSNAKTRIGFQLAQTVLAQLKVYDIHGRELATLFDAVADPGSHEVELDVSTLSSGVYFYRLRAGDFVQTKKFTLLQ